MAWDRSQKYHPRERTLYALLFPNGCCYVGQSVNPHEREQQHRRPAGGWNRPFVFQTLGQIVGTEEEAADYECAWRLQAQARGFRIYGKPPGMVVNPRRVAQNKHHRLARTLKWPSDRAKRSPAWWFWLIATLVLLGVGFMLFPLHEIPRW